MKAKAELYNLVFDKNISLLASTPFNKLSKIIDDQKLLIILIQKLPDFNLQFQIYIAVAVFIY